MSTEGRRLIRSDMSEPFKHERRALEHQLALFTEHSPFFSSVPHPLRRKSDHVHRPSPLLRPDSPDRFFIEPISNSERDLLTEWQDEIQSQQQAIHRRILFRETLLEQMPVFTVDDLPVAKSHGGREEVRNQIRIASFWNALRISQRRRVCRSLAVVHVLGFSNAAARDMKKSLYHDGTLNRNLWNYALILLARFEPGEILTRFGQQTQLVTLDAFKAMHRERDRTLFLPEGQ
jgi:hypothetical protein